MGQEYSAGAVLFRMTETEAKYLILHYVEGHWDFPKGKIEASEGFKDTAVREIREETGITQLDFYPDFREKIHYYYTRQGETIYKEVVYFLAETETEAVTISDEHIGFEWLSYEAALERLTHDNARELLKQAHPVVQRHYSVSEKPAAMESHREVAETPSTIVLSEPER